MGSRPSLGQSDLLIAPQPFPATSHQVPLCGEETDRILFLAPAPVFRKGGEKEPCLPSLPRGGEEEGENTVEYIT